METVNIQWFSDNIVPKLKGYELNYRFFDEGDFGSLNQVEFNSKKIGGNIDFWELGWLGIFIWNYETQEQLFNILIEPNQVQEKEKAMQKLQEILQ
jgi:hypothetical protein